MTKRSKPPAKRVHFANEPHSETFITKCLKHLPIYPLTTLLLTSFIWLLDNHLQSLIIGNWIYSYQRHPSSITLPDSRQTSGKWFAQLLALPLVGHLTHISGGCQWPLLAGGVLVALPMALCAITRSNVLLTAVHFVTIGVGCALLVVPTLWLVMDALTRRWRSLAVVGVLMVELGGRMALQMWLTDVRGHAVALLLVAAGCLGVGVVGYLASRSIEMRTTTRCIDCAKNANIATGVISLIIATINQEVLIDSEKTDGIDRILCLAAPMLGCIFALLLLFLLNHFSLHSWTIAAIGLILQFSSACIALIFDGEFHSYNPPIAILTIPVLLFYAGKSVAYGILISTLADVDQKMPNCHQCAAAAFAIAFGKLTNQILGQWRTDLNPTPTLMAVTGTWSVGLLMMARQIRTIARKRKSRVIRVSPNKTLRSCLKPVVV